MACLFYVPMWIKHSMKCCTSSLLASHVHKPSLLLAPACCRNRLKWSWLLMSPALPLAQPAPLQQCYTTCNTTSIHLNLNSMCQGKNISCTDAVMVSSSFPALKTCTRKCKMIADDSCRIEPAVAPVWPWQWHYAWYQTKQCAIITKK